MSRIPVGVPLRLAAVACICLAVVGGLFAGSATERAASQPSATLAVVQPATVEPPVAAMPEAPPQSLAVFLSPNSLASPIATEGLAPRRMPRMDPAVLCGLIDVGKKTSPWTQSLIFPGEWECLSMDDKRPSAKTRRAKAAAAAEEAGAGKPLMFAMARGTREGYVSYIRFKVSADDNADAEAETGIEIAADRLEKVLAMLGTTMPERASLSTRLMQPFDIDEGGVQFRFVKEVQNDRRYNLIVTFPREKAGILSPDYQEVILLSRSEPPECRASTKPGCSYIWR